MVVEIVRYWKEVGKEIWENSLTYHGWWKYASAFLVLGAVLAVLVSESWKGGR